MQSGFVVLQLWETNDISLFCRCLFLNSYLKSKDLISDKIMHKILAQLKVKLAE